MESREHKRRENRQNLFSFGNLKKDFSNASIPLYQHPRARVQTQPEARCVNRSYREPLAPKNANVVFNFNQQRTPSFNFIGIEPNFDRPIIAEQAKRGTCQGKRARGYSPHNFGCQRYFYDPSIEDISKKYGINMNNLKTGRRESIGKTQMQSCARQPIRQYSQAKLCAKNYKELPRFYEDSFQNQMGIPYRFKLRNKDSMKGFYYPNPQKPSFEIHQAFPEPAFEPYPTLYDPISDEVSNPQDTIDSINQLNQKINEKVNRILNDEYIYY